MKIKRGYILLEAIISVFIMSMIIGCLYSIIITSVEARNSIEDKIELSQQVEEMEYQIKDLIENCINIINITTVDKEIISDLEYNKVYNISSIKLNFKNNDNNSNTNLKNKEISYKKISKKIFINTLNNSNYSESGGYEIGDYVENIEIKKETPKIVSVTLNLQKNNVKLNKEVKFFIRNDYDFTS